MYTGKLSRPYSVITLTGKEAVQVTAYAGYGFYNYRGLLLLILLIIIFFWFIWN